MPLFNCEINLMLNWSKNKICYSRYKLYVPIVTLSIQDNAKLLEELNAIVNLNN